MHRTDQFVFIAYLLDHIFHISSSLSLHDKQVKMLGEVKMGFEIQHTELSHRQNKITDAASNVHHTYTVLENQILS